MPVVVVVVPSSQHINENALCPFNYGKKISHLCCRQKLNSMRLKLFSSWAHNFSSKLIGDLGCGCHKVGVCVRTLITERDLCLALTLLAIRNASMPPAETTSHIQSKIPLASFCVGFFGGFNPFSIFLVLTKFWNCSIQVIG